MNLCEQMHEVLLEDSEMKKSSPIRLIQYLLETARDEGIIEKDYPQDYLETTFFSRIISFVLYVDGDFGIKERNVALMKLELYEGLCRELRA